MKESEFIEQNKKKWLEFENSLEENIPDPSKTTKLFVQITDDLSYARTFYKNRSVRLYLNAIARVLFNDLNKAGREKGNRFLRFFTTDLPLAIYSARRAMLISLLVFVASFVIGVLSSRHDVEFAASILSSDYIHMTDENIKKGDAMAVYKQESEIETFLPILLNNLKVDLLTFFAGLIMAIGSLVVMISNGVMVGVFQYYFISKGLFWESFLGIWTHGALEIPTIILSGGAGLTLGKGLLFPGTYSRFQAFKISAMQGLKIVLGVAPLTLLAAFIEGFITRHTDFPDAVRFGFIVLSVILVVSYYYLYPRRVAKRNPLELDTIDDKALAYKEEIPFEKSNVLSAPEIITYTFRFLFQNFSKYALFIFTLPLLFGIAIAINPDQLFRNTETYSFDKKYLVDFGNYPVAATLTLLALAFTIYGSVSIAVERSNNTKNPGIRHFKTGAVICALIASAAFSLLLYSDMDYVWLVISILVPVLISVTAVAFTANESVFKAFGTAFGLIGQSFGRFAGSTVLLILLGLLVNGFTMYGTRIFFIQQAIFWAVTDNGEVVKNINQGILGFQLFFSLFTTTVLITIANVLLYYSIHEVSTAEHLKEKIKSIQVVK